MSLHLSLNVSASHSVCPCLCLSRSLSLCLSVSLSFSLSLCLCLCLPVSLRLCLRLSASLSAIPCLNFNRYCIAKNHNLFMLLFKIQTLHDHTQICTHTGDASSRTIIPLWAYLCYCHVTVCTSYK